MSVLYILKNGYMCNDQNLPNKPYNNHNLYNSSKPTNQNIFILQTITKWTNNHQKPMKDEW
jgi:hypothetical protein